MDYYRTMTLSFSHLKEKPFQTGRLRNLPASPPPPMPPEAPNSSYFIIHNSSALLLNQTTGGPLFTASKSFNVHS